MAALELGELLAYSGDEWLFVGVLTVALALPWLTLAVLAVRNRPSAPWLAFGALSAMFPFANHGWSLVSGTTQWLLLGGVGALLGSLVLQDAHTLSPRWRVSLVAVGGIVPWILYHAGLALLAPTPAFAAPWTVAPLAGLAIGGIALCRGRTWSLIVLAFSALTLLLAPLPDESLVLPSCFGPIGHPFAYTAANGFLATCAMLAVAPWVCPFAQAMQPRPSGLRLRRR